ncbi:MAG: hypothetical protein RLZZ528_207 [Pseudomonadota bacterium]|jgi:hypothetical protein
MRWLAAAFALAGVPAGADIVTADYAEPTGRYDHAVLGDALEWGALVLRLSDGRRLTYRLPETLVFEDLEPRLADLDGDGAPEVVVVEASLTAGARLAVWDETGRVAATAHYGQPHRWLAPAGIADLDQDGQAEIAYVDRPHLARVLEVVRLEGDKIVPVAETAGLTNHRIGDAFIQGGIVDCGGTPHVVTATADWQGIALTSFPQGRAVTQVVGGYAGPDSLRPRQALCP